MDKLKINEAIIVEGRDDIYAVSKACDALIIATHGFGIKRQTWELIEKAYKEKGIIILTDPDFSGEEIRRQLTQKFPEAKQAYISRKKAKKADNIGVENANPNDIREAILKTKVKIDSESDSKITQQDMVELGLIGTSSASRLRESVGEEFGVGYGNGKAFLKKLNGFGITKEELLETVNKIVKEK